MAEAAMTTVITTVASTVISSILNNLATRSLNELDSSGDIDSIKFKLGAVQSYLKNVIRLEKHKMREIERVVYCAEEAIEKILWLQQQRRRQVGCAGSLLRYNHYHSECCKTLCQINGEFKKIGDLIPGIFESNTDESSCTVNQFQDQSYEDPRETPYYNINSHEVIGFDNLTQDILKEGSSNDQNLAVVSIWGMGGIGKSTLANKVFDKAEHFQVKVWITVSQQYDVLNLRKKILQNTIKIDEETLGNITDKEVCQRLYASLGENRYLIVLDDIWDTKSLDDIYFFKRVPHDNINPSKSMFPDINNASRIIVTTRKLPVAKQPNIKTFIHELKPLDDEQGWKLLKGKAFPSYVSVSKPLKTNLESLGSEIVKKCEGLPLALVVLGGYLSKHHDCDTWNKMARDVNWKEAGEQINISRMLALSYDDLPNELKPIFLYITAFLEDSIVKSSDLIKLWIAEGFIPPPRGNNKLETTARFYLHQLYERGLVQVVKWSRAHQRIRKIRIHDVLRDWGIERSEEDGFFKVINNSDNATPSDAHILYRVALHDHWDENLGTSMPHLRTLLKFPLKVEEFSFGRLNSLRAVSLICDIKRPKYYSNFINHMRFLRYICFRNGGTINLSSSIGQIYNLQTLDCRNCRIISLPSSLWKISTLRHVYLKTLFGKWRGPKKGLGKNLQALAIYSYEARDSAWNGTIEAIEEMKEIVHLGLGNVRKSLHSNILSKIKILGSLEVLKLKNIEGLTRIPSGIFPLSIMEIELSCDELDEDPMPVFWELPKLVVLKLGNNSHLKGMHCSAAAGGFPRLKYLKISSFRRLEEWKVDTGAMPSLCHIRLEGCSNLRSLSELMDHNQLQLLELLYSTKLSIVDYQKFEQQRKFQVIATNTRKDSRLSNF